MREPRAEGVNRALFRVFLRLRLRRRRERLARVRRHRRDRLPRAPAPAPAGAVRERREDVEQTRARVPLLRPLRGIHQLGFHAVENRADARAAAAARDGGQAPPRGDPPPLVRVLRLRRQHVRERVDVLSKVALGRLQQRSRRRERALGVPPQLLHRLWQHRVAELVRGERPREPAEHVARASWHLQLRVAREDDGQVRLHRDRARGGERLGGGAPRRRRRRSRPRLRGEAGARECLGRRRRLRAAVAEELDDRAQMPRLAPRELLERPARPVAAASAGDDDARRDETSERARDLRERRRVLARVERAQHEAAPSREREPLPRAERLRALL